jgi:hypothetical protein
VTKIALWSALKTMFEPLRVCLERVKRKMDIARGFDALDAACEGARGSALSVFTLGWDHPPRDQAGS